MMKSALRWVVSFLVFLMFIATTMILGQEQENDASPPEADETLIQLREEAAQLPNFGVAPEIHDSMWLNTEVPLKLEALRGNVVLLDMWTFGCINCIRTIPYLREWYEQYAEDGLVVIGNHYPEFSYEHVLGNVRDALVRLDVPYPVLIDNDRETWGAYNNRYWPTIYLIDKQGNVRYRHIGEGQYEGTERVIQALLAEEYTQPELVESSERLLSLTPIEALNVRVGPDVSYERIDTIYPNEAYLVLETLDGWHKILFDGEDAYVSGEYVQLSSERDELEEMSP